MSDISKLWIRQRLLEYVLKRKYYLFFFLFYFVEFNVFVAVSLRNLLAVFKWQLFYDQFVLVFSLSTFLVNVWTQCSKTDQIYVIYMWVCKWKNTGKWGHDKYTTVMMMSGAPFCTHKPLNSLLNVSLYNAWLRIYILLNYEQYLTDQELHDDPHLPRNAETARLQTEDAKPWTGSNQRLPAARHTGNSTLKIRPHTTSEAIALRWEGQTAASNGQMSWTRDGKASFERLYTGSSMRPAWKLPVKDSLCLKKCFRCVSRGWKCLI